jgi:hypothetical protein
MSGCADTFHDIARFGLARRTRRGSRQAADLCFGPEGNRFHEIASSLVNALRRVFGLRQIRVADPSRIDQALQWYEEGLDFGDALHLASSQKAERFVTFDRKFVSRSSGLGAVRVDKP